MKNNFKSIEGIFFSNFIVVGVWFIFFLSSCQSSKESIITKQQLPKSIVSYFGSCTDVSGASNVQVYVKDKLKTSFDIEWSESSKEFKLVFSNSLGQDLAYLQYNDSNKSISTDINNIVPYKISLDQKGYLNVDDFRVPIKIKELPCILEYKYPSSWLKEEGISKIKNRYVWDTDWDIRDISTNFIFKKNKSSVKDKSKNKNKNKNIISNKIYSCSTIKWRTFLFFHSSLKICHEEGKYMIIDFNDHILKFTNID